jgi:predicted ATPase
MMAGMSVRRRPLADHRAVRSIRAHPDVEPDLTSWPATVPAVAHLLREGLELAPLTVLVGENGSGKSTLVEILAEAYGLNPQGGSQQARYESRPSEPGIGRDLILERSAVRPHWAYFIRADTSHGLYSYLEEHPGRGEPTYHELSHGEGFLALLQKKASQAGFYLLDEPDAALSFTATLALVAIINDLVAAGSQIVLATHSPIVAATPGAAILELGEWGIRPTTWADLELVGAWRSFLEAPDRYLRLLIDDD